MSTLIYDIETDGLLDTVSKVHCVVMKVFGSPRLGIYVADKHMDATETWLRKETNGVNWLVLPFGRLRELRMHRLVAHNQIGFDLVALRRLLNVDLQAENMIVDTLTLSQYLCADRNEGHSLAAWGKQFEEEKVEVNDWQGGEFETYLYRCVQDVLINEKVYEHLRHQLAPKRLHAGFQLAMDTYAAMQKQERTGVCFDISSARSLLEQIKSEMVTLAAEVEPTLGEAPLPKNQQPTWPKRPYKKDGSLSVTALNYGKRLGITDPAAVVYIIEKGEPVVLTCPIKLDNNKQLKEYFFTELGWKPTLWRTKDLTLDGKKRRPSLEVDAQAQKYVRDIWAGPYREEIWKEIAAPVALRKPLDDLTETEWHKAVFFIWRHPRQLPMSPQLCYPVTKAPCPNLEKLEGIDIQKILRWMSLKNRRGVLEGWLANDRLKVDDRLSAGASQITNTHRQRHHTVVNVPKNDPKVIYGKEMRSLFVAPCDQVCVGCDAAGLENRVAGHYTTPFDGGEYARILLDGDTHAVNADAYSKAIDRAVSRSDSKPITYGTLYGASGKKIARMLDVSLELGHKVVDAFWNANPGLKEFKEWLEGEWKRNGKKFVRGLDGRYIYTRSQHSLVNCVFQSAGAIIMDRAWQLTLARKPQDLCMQRWGYFHDEYQVYAAPESADEVGKLIADSIAAAGEHYNLNVPLAGDYSVGRSWAETH